MGEVLQALRYGETVHAPRRPGSVRRFLLLETHFFVRCALFLLTNIGQLPYSLLIEWDRRTVSQNQSRNMKQNEKRYNGWTNYGTWTTALWLDNNERSHNYWREIAGEFKLAAPQENQFEKGYWSIEEAARFMLADRLKEQIEERSPLQEASLYSDLLAAALQEVNWSEIAGHLLADLGDD